MLESEETWHCDSDGNRVYTMVRKCNPIMDSFRRRGLHLPREETPSCGQVEVDVAFFGDEVMALTGYQVGETQLYQPDSTRATMSSMTMATRYPVVACPLIWEICGDMAAPPKKAGLGQ